MPRAVWLLQGGRPCVSIVLTLDDGTEVDAELLADTGGGAAHATSDLILPEDDCRLCGAVAVSTADLEGAYSGTFPLFKIRVRIPALAFDEEVDVVGVPSVDGFAGLACFRFLDRFGYGNFGDPALFGLEC
ncbi:MAG: hypothetical protein K2W96_22405 [Gemmataceae bacterium]|nr:hypothetical protein [Gemmataceae bacterium]